MANFVKLLLYRIKMHASTLSKGIQGVITNSKSTILWSIGGLLGTLVGMLIILVWIKAPEWLVVATSITLGIIILVFLFTYVYCLFTDPSLLRSERHTEQMTAISKGFFISDNISGTNIVKLDQMSTAPVNRVEKNE